MQAETYQSDIYPPAASGEFALTAEQWFAGADAEAPQFDLETLYATEGVPKTTMAQPFVSVAAAAPAAAQAAQAAAAPAPTKTTTARAPLPSVSPAVEPVALATGPAGETARPTSLIASPVATEPPKDVGPRSPVKAAAAAAAAPPPKAAISPAPAPALAAAPAAPAHTAALAANDAITEQLSELQSQNVTLISQVRELTRELDTLKKRDDELTETQLLALVPPSITYIPARKKSKATTDSPHGRNPHSVRRWDNFLRDANGMAMDDTTQQFDRPIFKHSEASVEEDVRVALEINVFDVLSATLGNRQQPEEKFRRAPALISIKGIPDFILLAGDKLLFPIEVKTKWILPDDNIVGIFNAKDTPAFVFNSIRQIFGYMAQNKRRYGVLSTYDKTWFLQRPKDNRGVLFISDVVKDENTSPTLLQCFAHIMSLARQDPDCPSPPPSPLRTLGDSPEPPEEKDDEDKDPTYPPPKSGSGKGGRGSSRGGASRRGGRGSGRGGTGKKGGQGSGRGGTDKKGDNSNTSKRNRPGVGGGRESPGNEQLNRELRLENFDWDSFEVAGVLGEGRSGKVFEGTLRGESVVVKLTDLWQHPELHEEMLREARTYVELGKLQGHGIPKLKGVGYTAGGLFALMTEFGGSPIEVENLNDEKREMILHVLASIHSEGFLHGDLRCENILIEHRRDGPRITFIDFGFSRKFSNHKESEREMSALKRMIGSCSMKKLRLV